MLIGPLYPDELARALREAGRVRRPDTRILQGRTAGREDSGGTNQNKVYKELLLKELFLQE